MKTAKVPAARAARGAETEKTMVFRVRRPGFGVKSVVKTMMGQNPISL